METTAVDALSTTQKSATTTTTSGMATTASEEDYMETASISESNRFPVDEHGEQIVSTYERVDEGEHLRVASGNENLKGRGNWALVITAMWVYRVPVFNQPK